MSLAHLQELRVALAEAGWKIVAERLRGEDNVMGAATWEVHRGDRTLAVFIDFDGFGCMGEDVPLEMSSGCDVRGRRDGGLYFRRINRSRELWLRDLAAFIDSLGSGGDG